MEEAKLYVVEEVRYTYACSTATTVGRCRPPKGEAFLQSNRLEIFMETI